jgi:hypothetical protein
MKFKLNRSFYLHSGYALLESEPEFGLEVFGTPAGSVPVIGVGFAGRRQKPDWHYRFKSEEARSEYIAKYKSKLEGIAEYKLKQAVERKEVDNLLKLGDILECSWGYDQTNIDYYEVVKVLPKSVVILEIAQRKQMTGYESGSCWPLPGQYVGKPRTVRVKGESVKISSYSHAYKVKKNADGTYPEAHWTSYH